MANVIKIKNSNVGGNIPSSLEYGELALNYLDSALFHKNNSNVIIKTDLDFKLVSTFTYPGNLSVSTGQARFYMYKSGVIKDVIASVATTPVGSSVIVDILKNGTTIYTGGTGRPTITSGAFVDTSSVPSVTSFSTGDYFTVDIVQVGSTTAGANLVVELIYN